MADVVRTPTTPTLERRRQWLVECVWVEVCDAYDEWVAALPRQYGLCQCAWVYSVWPLERQPHMSSCYRFFFAMLSFVAWQATWKDVAPNYRGRKFLSQFMPENRRPIIPHPLVLAIMKRPQEVQLSEAWFAARTPSTHITATKMRTLFLPQQPGNPYASVDGVFRAKTAHAGPNQATAAPMPDNAPCRHGRIHEKVANVRYEEEELTLVCATGLLEHPEHKFLAASPDGIRVDVPVAVELKCPFRREDLGLIHTYWYQCQLQAQCLGPAVHTTHLFFFWTDSFAPPRATSWEYHIITRDDDWFEHTALPVLVPLWERIQACLTAQRAGHRIVYALKDCSSSGDGGSVAAIARPAALTSPQTQIPPQPQYAILPGYIAVDQPPPSGDSYAATSPEEESARQPKRAWREISPPPASNLDVSPVDWQTTLTLPTREFIPLGPFQWPDY